MPISDVKEIYEDFWWQTIYINQKNVLKKSPPLVPLVINNTGEVSVPFFLNGIKCFPAACRFTMSYKSHAYVIEHDIIVFGNSCSFIVAYYIIITVIMITIIVRSSYRKI